MVLEDVGEVGMDGHAPGFAVGAVFEGTRSRISPVLVQRLQERGRASVSSISPHWPGSVGW
jgi:hypothetical protein